LPEVAEHVTANEFDFFLIVNGGSFNEFGTVIAQDTETNGGDIALVFVAQEEELRVPLLDAGFLMLQTDAVVVGLEETHDGGQDFEKVGSRVDFAGAEGLEEAVGGDGSGAGGEAASGAGEFAGVPGMFFNQEEGFLFFEPAWVAEGAPVGKVAMVDGCAGEVVGEHFLDGRELIEPGEDFGGELAVVEALVELVADEVRETGNFAEEGALVHGIFDFRFLISDWPQSHGDTEGQLSWNLPMIRGFWRGKRVGIFVRGKAGNGWQ